MKDVRRYLGWPDAAVIVAFLIACVLLLLGWPPGWSWDWNAVAALGNWAAAAGTTAAVVVALRVATRDARYREENRLLERAMGLAYVADVAMDFERLDRLMRLLKPRIANWSLHSRSADEELRGYLQTTRSALERLDRSMLKFVSPVVVAGLNEAKVKLARIDQRVTSLVYTANIAGIREELVELADQACEAFERAWQEIKLVLTSHMGVEQ